MHEVNNLLSGCLNKFFLQLKFKKKNKKPKNQIFIPNQQGENITLNETGSVLGFTHRMITEDMNKSTRSDGGNFYFDTLSDLCIFFRLICCFCCQAFAFLQYPFDLQLGLLIFRLLKVCIGLERVALNSRILYDT